jgi:hypothetical protein
MAGRLKGTVRAALGAEQKWRGLGATFGLPSNAFYDS